MPPLCAWTCKLVCVYAVSHGSSADRSFVLSTLLSTQAAANARAYPFLPPHTQPQPTNLPPRKQCAMGYRPFARHRSRCRNQSPLTSPPGSSRRWTTTTTTHSPAPQEAVGDRIASFCPPYVQIMKPELLQRLQKGLAGAADRGDECLCCGRVLICPSLCTHARRLTCKHLSQTHMEKNSRHDMRHERSTVPLLRPLPNNNQTNGQTTAPPRAPSEWSGTRASTPASPPAMTPRRLAGPFFRQLLLQSLSC